MNFRTDLALERQEILGASEIEGVSSYSEHKNNVKITSINIENEIGSKKIGKPVGRYITVEVPEFSKDGEIFDGRLEALAEELRKLLPSDDGTVLVVGLGNENITPDALGPKCAQMILATRHLSAEFRESLGMPSLRSVAGISPGVLGQTGIETGEIIAGIVKKIKPSAVITVDALASRRLKRLGCTVQISDAGITPGSGVGNARATISSKTLGVPVIAVGVPTVVDAATLAYDILQGEKNEIDENAMRKALGHEVEQMMITPREIDLLIERASRLIAMSINCALHPDISAEDILSLVG
ncbi:MAG: GPR endopeptidase [Clostridia bacterium]|nr:GPR endopeptidase [Clostridia bacterium]